MTHEDLSRNALPTFSYPTPETVTVDAEARLMHANTLMDDMLATARNPEAELTCQNTLGMLDQLQDAVGWEGEAGRKEMLMAAVHPDAAIREAAGVAQGRLQNYWREVFFNEELYSAFKRFAGSDAARQLGPEQARALTGTMREFRLAGQELTPAQRQELLELHQKMDAIGGEFRSNLSKAMTHKLPLTKAEQAGLPKTFVEKLTAPEEQTAEPGTLLTDLTEFSATTILTHATNRHMREKVYTAFNALAPENKELIEDLANARLKAAQLLGYQSWADMQTEMQMAGSSAAVNAFFAERTRPLLAQAAAELEPMQRLLAADGHQGPVQAWDTAYYAAKLRENLSVKDEVIAEFLPLNKVLDGIFSLTGNLFGVRYEAVPDAAAWDEHVKAYRIIDQQTNEVLSTFYLDLFSREGKRGSAATYILEYGHEVAPGVHQQPITALIANLANAPKDKNQSPLLQPKALSTLLHEFGHLLHTGFARTNTVRFAGDHTQYDFREAVSQMFELWGSDPEVIRKLSSHYQTGMPIPPELIRNLPIAQKVDHSLEQIRRLLSLGIFDAAVHDGSTPKTFDTMFQRSEAVSATPTAPGTHRPTRFTHPFNPAYAGTYYGYLWSLTNTQKMLDLLSPTNPAPDMGRRYRTMLERGGSLPADELMRLLQPTNPNTLRGLGGAATT